MDSKEMTFTRGSLTVEQSLSDINPKLNDSHCDPVIHINQIYAGTKKEYEIFGMNAMYTAETPFYNKRGPVQLSGPNDASWLMKCKTPPLGRLIPFGLGSWGTGFGRKLRKWDYIILFNDQAKGSISTLRYDKNKTRYEVAFDDRICRIYPLLQGKHEFLLVFYGNTQIAHIKRETITRDLLGNYTVYLLDDFSAFVVPIILSVLYYNNYEHGNHGKSHKNASTQRTWGYSYGDANELYDPHWLTAHFPKEPTESVEIDLEKSRGVGRRLTIVQMIMEIIHISFILLLVYVLGLERVIIYVLLAFGANVCQRVYEGSSYYKGK